MLESVTTQMFSIKLMLLPVFLLSALFVLFHCEVLHLHSHSVLTASEQGELQSILTIKPTKTLPSLHSKIPRMQCWDNEHTKHSSGRCHNNKAFISKNTITN